MQNRNKKRYNRKNKMIALVLMNVLACQLLIPNIAMALTSGPTQPEVQGFEPVGTTDMVDMFSGSFVYNIPLMDVEGYPVNISYHGGVTMEQEASWVGLGWNINPGVINRTVRGVPDDFNGDTFAKDVNIKPEKTLRVGVGFGMEFGGFGDPKPRSLATGANFNVGTNITLSNYRGISCDFSFGGGINVTNWASAGVNLGVGSQSGASIDYNANLSLSSSNIIGKDQAASVGLNAGIGGGYSTRSGLKDLSLSVSASVKSNYDGSQDGGDHGHAGGGSLFSNGATIPIGVKNYVPVITNSSEMNSIFGRIKLGWEMLGGYAYANANAMYSTLTYNHNASRESYGYMYMQNAPADNTSILDFTRDKDGMFNKTMEYLPVPNMAYDIYSVSGQGTGGMFRPFRNDFGAVYDPYTEQNNDANTLEGEVGVGNVFEAGADYSHTHTEITSGPWGDYLRPGPLKGFTKAKEGSVYEHVYFKQGGELTVVNPDYFTTIGGEGLMIPDDAKNLPHTKPGSDTSRDARANLIYYRTAQEAAITGVGTDPNIISYTDQSFTTYGNPTTEIISRTGTGDFQRKQDHISEIVQVQKDGRKYVYGLPAINNVQREATFTVDPAANNVNLATGIVEFSVADASDSNKRGRDNYYTSTVTPAFTHSYLLTSVLSNDYTDVTGNGITDDDLGTYTKFEYTRTDSDYRWVTPYSTDFNLAQYNPGFWADKHDDKASFVCGSREQWNLHAIETRNYIAEFYTSVRGDARGIAAAILNHGESSIYNASKASGGSFSYKLDSIKLYNKHDRFVNGARATPVKSVFFVYDYQLCGGVPNSAGNGAGKLTLQKIYFSYGNSEKSMISPYQFGYANNLPYKLEDKDRWGNFKHNNPAFTNYEYPYVDQNDPMNDSNASAWSLSRISLPSGGTIEASYESNDYAFVQDKPVNEMFMLKGLGTTPNFVSASQLYLNMNTPCLYAYFKRRKGSELPRRTFAENYFGRNFKDGGPNCMYFNFNVQLVETITSFEQIKGYANITHIDSCPNNTDYGYIQFDQVTPTGGGADMNPVSYTAINTARYNLPQIIYPGANPDESDITNLIAGMKTAFDESHDMTANPLIALIGSGDAQNVNLDKSYIRLQSVGLIKKGGGQRVKGLYFYDNWRGLAGSNEPDATYGKLYSYSLNDSDYGQISSGVASYEPLIGGDENPWRQPVQYTVQSGSKWPRNDAIDLYQETPMGESLFPTGQVGYSSVVVSSIHKDEGRGSRSRDVYEFYTAKDFPVLVVATSLDEDHHNTYTFFDQINYEAAKQGYTLIFNDMHGKPKKTEHDVYNATDGFKLVSSQFYHYKQDRNKLDNNVNCLVYDGANMVVSPRQLGVEEDITLDSRQKLEVMDNVTINASFNFFFLGVLPTPIFYGFPWENKSHNEFLSAVVTKVVQQYGILESVDARTEGATTTFRNEYYDPNTGQPVVTSITNEFRDKEYTTNIPASWVYKGMSGAYENIGYKDTGSIRINSDYIGTLHITNTTPLTEGDQLIASFTDRSGLRNIVLWVMGILPTYSQAGIPSCTGVNVIPRFPQNTPGWDSSSLLSSVSIKVINSGHKNRLDENVETYTSLNSPIHSGGNKLDADLTGIIDLKAKTFCDSNTRIFSKFLVYGGAINPYATAERGAWRLLSEYSYLTNRNYSGATTRNAGLYNAPSMYTSAASYTTPPCSISPYKFLMPYKPDPNWHAMRTITKWSPFGQEVENVDAVGNYSTAVYGYADDLPVAVASNAKQGEILSLGFEDFKMLKSTPDSINYRYFKLWIDTLAPLPVATPKYKMLWPYIDTIDVDASSSFIATDAGHTGCHSIATNANSLILRFAVDTTADTGIVNKYHKYNNYFSTSPVGGYRFSSANEYLPFTLKRNKDYILSYWIKPIHPELNVTTYFHAVDSMRVNVYDSVSRDSTLGGWGLPGVLPVSRNIAVKKINMIDGWEQWQVRFFVPDTAVIAEASFARESYVDDIRVFPADANMKAFVYGPVKLSGKAITRKLISTLDENNFATMYEYDQEGNLVRVKKETTNGIMTTSESRSGNPKK